MKFNLSGLKKRFNSVKKRFKFDMTRNPRPTKKRKKISWKKVFIVCGYVVLAFILVTAVTFAWFAKDLPTPEKIAQQQMAQSTKIYDRTGKVLLYQTGNEKRTIVKSDQISQTLKDATIATEDPGFYNNHGIEPIEILKAIGSKLIGKTNTLRGGSTITQQYVKNSFLTPDRSISRKIKEAIISIELEFMYSKDEILTMYLNEIPYGNANGGIEAAAQSYYGVSAKDLGLAESATLAAIPQAPTYYSPYGTHLDDLVGRKNYVLNQMVKHKKITKAEADAAKTEDTTTVGQLLQARRDPILAPHFSMYVLQQAVNEYGESAIQSQGLKIVTSLDWDKQQIAEEAITNGVPKLIKYGASNGALVAVDPKTGQILAMVGSADYFDTAIDGNFNVADAGRQPGSSFKPIVYATAFKQSDFSPSRILYDFTTNFGGTPPYIPQDDDGKNRGPVTVRDALAQSLNIPAVKVLGLAGIDEALKTAKDMGITSLTQRDRYGLSLVLGVGEVSPLEMASAYSTFANAGTHNETTPFLKVTDSSGKTLYDFDKDHPSGKQVLDPQIAYEMSSILSDNAARTPVFGSRSGLFLKERPVAAKTGTTSDFKDAWTDGYTPSLAVSVWTGNSNNKAMKKNGFGATLAAPIFHEFMTKALAGTAAEEFAKPDGIQTITVERYSNKLPDEHATATTTDIFATWQVPKEKENIYKQVTVCKGTNLIAPDGTNTALIETKVFADLHSEKPSNPNWENPVRAWAEANGLATTIPTGQCDVAAMSPTIHFVSPADKATVTGSTIITVTAIAPNGIANITYFIDDVQIGQTTSDPYTLKYDFNSISAGTHKLTAQISDVNAMTASADINITIATLSLDVSGLLAKSNTGTPPSATITWTTNLAANSSITYSTGTLPSVTKSDSIKTTSHSLTLTNLTAGKTYNYTVISTDNYGNTDTATGFFTTP
ncbi:hypothetical protein COT78_01405 [Candidatus Berkelbacteria bacterium CG10_big_fil_rev_8_21_14_0_10_43_13]|uniref:Fibronectin type-III domain-containing protein n=1 Tax=Candidatus Berkelbacteria bacterium CG10_big_fil_rev_8_21_14_0_10_43_13 TaxID=1974514 RepID=A0A2H0W717_9BACT|nr:MAG: hypothetical protein COT78_01405 [Candidatus Berkelbacteria bacterium CG10_big_fil_rev_8_21_14_0_10_43_13]